MAIINGSELFLKLSIFRSKISHHIIHTNNCTIVRYKDIERVVNLLHVSTFFGHRQGGI